MRIFKYRIGRLDIPRGLLCFFPKGFERLDYGVQDDYLVMWAEVDPEAEGLQSMIIYLRWTGDRTSDDETFFKTIQHDGLVWHVYESEVYD